MTINKWYREDLAYIHDEGYKDYPQKSTYGILAILTQNQINQELIVELGCGNGLLARDLVKANYRVLGVDISKSMIDIAKNRVPQADFRVESMYTTTLPLCNGVISIGECLNYLFDDSDNKTLSQPLSQISQLFYRIYNALTQGGVLIFDMITSGESISNPVKGFREGEDWVVLFEKHHNLATKILTRKIVTFRQVGEYYRRDEEIHQQMIYEAKDIVRQLEEVGFQVEISSGYGDFLLPKTHQVFIAKKLDSKSTVNK